MSITIKILKRAPDGRSTLYATRDLEVMPVSIGRDAACTIALYEFSHGLTRYAAGWHGGSGDHSSALLTFMPCLAMAGWYASRAGWPRRATFAIGSLAVLMAASAYATLSRTLWLGFAVEFVVLGAANAYLGLRAGMLLSEVSRSTLY